MSTAMVLPKLYASVNDITISTTAAILKKYRHLIDFKPNAAILEFGIGDGGNTVKSLAPLLPHDYKEYIGTDISPAMLDYAKNHANIPKSRFAILNIAAESLPREFRGRFDHVFSFYALKQNVAREALRNVHEALKSQGDVFLVYFKRLPVEDAFEAMSKYPKWGKYNHEMMMMKGKNGDLRREYEIFAEEAGFKEVLLEEEEVSYTFPDENTWKDLYLSVNPVVANIPQGEMEEYKVDYFSEIRKHTLFISENDKNEATVNYTLYILCAKKG